MSFYDYIMTALKNLSRQKSRTGLTIVAITVGSLSLILMASLIVSIRQSLVDEGDCVVVRGDVGLPVGDTTRAPCCGVRPRDSLECQPISFAVAKPKSRSRTAGHKDRDSVAAGHTATTLETYGSVKTPALG